MKFSKRLDQLAPYPFVEISRIIAEKRAAGAEVVTFGIGDPDIPTPSHIINRLVQASHEAPNHRYPETDGLPELRKTIAQWYESRFDVRFDPSTEVLPLIGAKEGIGHVAFCFLDPGDIALVPDPAYPVYVDTNVIVGRTADAVDGQYEGLVYLPCTEANGFVPEPPSERVDLIYLCNPNNPTGAVATKAQLQAFVSYARENKAVIIFDAAYSAYITDPDLPRSI